MVVMPNDENDCDAAVEGCGLPVDVGYNDIWKNKLRFKQIATEFYSPWKYLLMVFPAVLLATSVHNGQRI